MAWNVDRVKAYAVLELKDHADDPQVTDITLDVLRVTASWSLNDRPRCSLAVALGRRAGLIPSDIHFILSRLKTKQKVTVYLQLTTLGFLGKLGINAWPNEPFVLFEGYTTGAGYRRTSSGAEYLLHLEHWTSDLSYASAVSAISSPENPNALIFNALVGDPAESATGRGMSSGMTGLSLAERFVTGASLETDFWGDALQPWFLRLAGLEEVARTDVPAEIGLDLGDAATGNEAAVRALRRFEPLSADEPKKYGCGAPLNFSLEGDRGLAADRIVATLGIETLEALSGHTLWDKLIQYAGTYLFAVAPLVTKALIVPFVPGLRQEWRTIKADSYDYVEIQGDMPRLLRGVGIYGGRGFDGGADLEGGVAVDYSRLGIGGYFQGANGGQILFKQAPGWMANTLSPRGSATSSGAGGGVRGNASFPGVGSAPDGPSRVQQAEDCTRIMDAYAEALYVYEVLKMRQGSLSGILRFDICPGSVVRVEGCGEKFLGLSDDFGQEMWATVLETSVSIDSENSRAGTVFRMAHWRNKLENSTRGFSLDRHPIWGTAWSGCELISFP